jgi:hypothetical protein
MNKSIFIFIIILIILLLYKFNEKFGCIMKNDSGVEWCMSKNEYNYLNQFNKSDENKNYFNCPKERKCNAYRCINTYNGIVTKRDEPCWLDEIYYK